MDGGSSSEMSPPVATSPRPAPPATRSRSWSRPVRRPSSANAITRAHRPTGTCSNGSSSTTSTRPGGPGGGPGVRRTVAFQDRVDHVRIGIVCPYSFDIPGRSAVPRARPRRGVPRARATTSASSPRPSSETVLPDYMVSAGRAVPRAGSTAPPPGSTSAPDGRRPGLEPLGGVRRVRPHPPARADHAERRRAGALGGGGSHRRDLPHLDAALAGLPGRVPDRAPQPGEDHRPDRGVRGRPPDGDAPTSAATRSSSPTGCSCDRFDGPRCRDPDWTGTPERPTVAFLGRMEEPRKGMPVLAAALPRDARRRLPGLRVLVAGPGRPPPR